MARRLTSVCSARFTAEFQCIARLVSGTQQHCAAVSAIAREPVPHEQEGHWPPDNPTSFPPHEQEGHWPPDNPTSFPPNPTWSAIRMVGGHHRSPERVSKNGPYNIWSYSDWFSNIENQRVLKNVFFIPVMNAVLNANQQAMLSTNSAPIAATIAHRICSTVDESPFFRWSTAQPSDTLVTYTLVPKEHFYTLKEDTEPAQGFEVCCGPSCMQPSTIQCQPWQSLVNETCLDGCMTDAECASNKCINGTCDTACATDADCPGSNQYCLSQLCQSPPTHWMLCCGLSSAWKWSNADSIPSSIQDAESVVVEPAEEQWVCERYGVVGIVTLIPPLTGSGSDGAITSPSGDAHFNRAHSRTDHFCAPDAIQQAVGSVCGFDSCERPNSYCSASYSPLGYCWECADPRTPRHGSACTAAGICTHFWTHTSDQTPQDRCVCNSMGCSKHGCCVDGLLYDRCQRSTVEGPDWWCPDVWNNRCVNGEYCN